MNTCDEDVYSYLIAHGTQTINQIARQLKRKHETIARAVNRLEKTGRVYVETDGNVNYVSPRGFPLSERVRPAPLKEGSKMETKTDLYGRVSVDVSHRRAKNTAERLPLDGFVCHPLTKGCDVGRDFVRMHIKGMYTVGVTHAGDFQPYNKIDDTAIDWKRTGLSLNVAYNGRVFLKGSDSTAYAIRAVETRAGAIQTLCVFIHPRYIYFKNHVATACVEFSQQVKDVCQALELHGWTFNYDTIELKGELHTGINDTVLGSQVGRYNQQEGDALHFDHSHAIPECEVYGEDPDTVELMVNLPQIIRGMSESLNELKNALQTVLDIQTKTALIILPTNDQKNNDIMYR